MEIFRFRLFLVLGAIGITSYTLSGVPRNLSSKIVHPLDRPKVLVYGTITLNRKAIPWKKGGMIYLRLTPLGKNWDYFNTSKEGQWVKRRPIFDLSNINPNQSSYRLRVPPGSYRVSIYIVDAIKVYGYFEYPANPGYDSAKDFFAVQGCDRLFHAYSSENTPLVAYINSNKSQRYDFNLKSAHEKPLH